jgi:hypothetical protein
MEWMYRIEPAVEVARLEVLCALSALPALCADVYEVTESQLGERAEASCVWGVFDTRRSSIRNGVRYELLSCPNALQWTVTTCKGETILHGSINQEAPDADFAETIHVFLDNFRKGLMAAASA